MEVTPTLPSHFGTVPISAQHVHAISHDQQYNDWYSRVQKSYYATLKQRSINSKVYLQAEHPVSLLSVLLVLHPKWKQWFSLWIFPLVTKQVLYVVRIRDCNCVIIKDFLSINLPILLSSIFLNLMYSCVAFVTYVVE